MTEPARIGHLLIAVLLVAAGACSQDRNTASTGTAPGVTGIRYLAAGESDAGFALALEPRRFVFPEDHAAHPGFRTEWWYFTGNVFDDSDDRYGFELTIFRVALTAAAPAGNSALATNEVWMAHLAVTDAQRQLFQTAERLSRGAAGLASATSDADGNGVQIVIEDFGVRFAGDSVSLSAQDDGFGIDFELSGLDRVVAQGNEGLDPKGPEPGNASYYFSAPRLSVSGELRSADAEPVSVRGSAWMDREWSTSALSTDIAGWDWFALQLDDGRDLMFYRLRGRDGRTSEFSGGSLTDSAGNSTRLNADDVVLTPTRQWTSARTNVRYPVAWTMRLPDRNLELDIEPVIDDQELNLTVRYWEGAVTVGGRADGEAITGVGYLELAGY